jgi:hypothetical protein
MQEMLEQVLSESIVAEATAYWQPLPSGSRLKK